jgi:hypothetical protein
MQLLTKGARFISDHTLSSTVVDHLNSQQAQIKDFQATGDDQWWEVEPHTTNLRAAALFDKLRSLDMCSYSEDQLCDAMEFFACGNLSTTLERLSLSMHPHSYLDDSLTSVLELAVFPRLPKLQEFSLSNFEKVDVLFPVLSHSIDFASLLRLNIIECEEGNQFFSALHEHIQHKVMALQHLGLSIENKTDGVAGFLSSCHSLTSLHINILDAVYTSAFLRKLAHVVPFLRTFAIHQEELDALWELNGSDDYTEAFDALFRPACNLHSLGYQLQFQTLEFMEGIRTRHFEDILVSPLRLFCCYSSFYAIHFATASTP